MVPEDVAEKFRSQLRYCQDCKARDVKVEFQYRERITNVNRSH